MKSLVNFKKILLNLTFCFLNFYFSQNVGINTSSPEKELDVNGELKVRIINQLSSITNNESVLIVNNTDNVIKKIDPNLLNGSTNTSILSVKKESNLSLLDLSFDLGSNWKIINFGTSDIKIGSNSIFSNAIYTVPSTGIYKIGYYFRYGNGIQTTLLSTQPVIGILKTTGNTITVLDSREFQGISIPLVLSLNLTENSIDSLFSLQTGDKIVFAINTGGISLSLLNASSSSAYIYKISN